MNHKDWLRDPIWQFLGVVVGAAVSIDLAVIGPITLPDKVRLVVVIIVLLGTVLCLIFVLRRAFGASNQLPRLTAPKPQPMHSRHSQAKQAPYDDPIVIDEERKGEILAVFMGLFMLIFFVIGVVGLTQVKGNWFETRFETLLSIGLILVGLMFLPFLLLLLRKECLKIGSEGIAVSPGRLFIPWDEMSRIYTAGFNEQDDHLYVELKDHSRLHFLKPIKSRYANGTIDICTASDPSQWGIPKHLIEYALDIYTPYGVERSRK